MAFILSPQNNHRCLEQKGNPRDHLAQTELCLAHPADGCIFFPLCSLEWSDSHGSLFLGSIILPLLKFLLPKKSIPKAKRHC